MTKIKIEDYCKAEEGFCFACCLFGNSIDDPDLESKLREKTEIFEKLKYDLKEYEYAVEDSFPGCPYLGYKEDDTIGCMIHPKDDDNEDLRDNIGYDCCKKVFCIGALSFMQRNKKDQKNILKERQKMNQIELSKQEHYNLR